MKINEIITESRLDEHIVKVKGGYRLLSHKGKNLGTFPSRAAAQKHEREVQYFKHANDGVTEGEWDGTGETDMAAAVTAAGNSAEDAETEKAIAMSETSDYVRRGAKKKAGSNKLEEFTNPFRKTPVPSKPKASSEEMRKYFAKGSAVADPKYSNMSTGSRENARKVYVRNEDSASVPEPVEAWGYAYNNSDQRVMWCKGFASEQEAERWASNKNATIMGMKPLESTQTDESPDGVSPSTKMVV